MPLDELLQVRQLALLNTRILFLSSQKTRRKDDEIMIEEKQEEGFSYAIQTSRGKGNFFYGSNQLIDYTYTTLVKCVLAILLSMLLRKFSHMHRVPFSILCPQS